MNTASCAENLFQWDVGQVLEIKGLNLINAPQVHFATKIDNVAYVVQSKMSDGTITASIPDKVLAHGYPIIAYIYLEQGIDKRTVKSITIPVTKRAKPNGYTETNAEDIVESVTAHEQLLREVQELKELVGSGQTEEIYAHKNDKNNPHNVTLAQVLGNDSDGGVVPIDKGGTGANNTAEALSNLGAVKTGDANAHLLGLFLGSDPDNSGYIYEGSDGDIQFRYGTGDNKKYTSLSELASKFLPLTGGTLSEQIILKRSGQTAKMYLNADNGYVWLIVDDGDFNNRRVVQLSSKSANASVSNMLRISDYVNGKNNGYAIYGEHNPPTYLRSTNHVNTGTDSNGGYAVTLAKYWEFNENRHSSGEATMVGVNMNASIPMFFNGWSITGEDFYFNGDVKIDGDIYGSPSIVSSDARKKHDILDIGDKYEAFFKSLRPVTFVYNDKTRNHVGFIAQEVASALESAGLTSKEFAGYIALPKFGTKEVEREVEVEEDVDVPVYDENGKVIETHIEKQTVTKTETVTVTDKDNVIDTEYMLRYEEFIALNTRMIQKLMVKVEALEARIAEITGETMV